MSGRVRLRPTRDAGVHVHRLVRCLSGLEPHPLRDDRLDSLAGRHVGAPACIRQQVRHLNEIRVLRCARHSVFNENLGGKG